MPYSRHVTLSSSIRCKRAPTRRCRRVARACRRGGRGTTRDVLQRQTVQKRKKFLRPLHLIIRRYPAYHMTARPQWHASSEKNRIPGLHRPPGHSKSRSSEHMQSMCRVPRGALEELDHSTLLLRPLSVLCRSHLQAIPRPCGGIEQHLCSPKHHGNIGPQIPLCATRSTRAERSVGT